MIQGYQDIFGKIKEYSGLGSVIVLFLCVVLFLALKREKERQVKIYLVYFLLLLGAMLNPATVMVLDLSGNLDVFERFFWLFQAPVLLAVGASEITKKKRSLLFLVMALILLCGKWVFTSVEFSRAENIYKISQDAIEVSDIIMRDFEGMEEDAEVAANRPGFSRHLRPRAAVTEPLCGEIRMYNADIDLWMVRRKFGNANKRRYRRVAEWLSLSTNEIPVDKLLKRLKKRDYTYLVLGDWQNLTGNVGDYDLEQIGATEHYRVLKYRPDSQVDIAHFSDPDNLGCMSYMLKTQDDKLIVVDGGRATMTMDMVDRIRENGGRVDAWIITHPHDDHAGVLASLLEAEWDKSEIEIGQIYMGEWDYEAVNAQGLRTDFVYYLTHNLETRDNVTILKKGDEVEVCGLKLKVLHTCNAKVTAESGNILNDGSMVFLLSSDVQSMLFMGDVGDSNPQLRADEGIGDDQIGEGSAMGRAIAKEILAGLKGNEKRIVAIQMPHHGNNLLPDSFYETIKPRYAFFDAPDWLMENRNPATGEPGYYTTPHYRALMESLGAKIITFEENADICIR